MKKLFFILLFATALPLLRAEDFSSCFVPGEVSKYKIYWLGIPLAWSQSSTDCVTNNGRKLIRITVRTEGYTGIYPVDDKMVLLIDPVTALPVRCDIILNEGSTHKINRTTFFHKRKVAVFQDRITRDIKEIPIEKDTQELYSFIYSTRKYPLTNITNKTHRILVEGKMYDLSFKIHEDEKINISGYGDVLCTTIEPIAEFDGIFIRKGKILFWVSKADRHMITMAKTKVVVGKVTIQLQSVSGPGTDFWIKNKKKE